MKNVLLILLVIITFIQVRAQESWNSRLDFSSTQDENSVWHYLEHDGNYNFTEMTFSQSENKWIGSEPNISIGQNISHPGSSKDVVRKWTAPRSFRIKITGTVNKTSANAAGDGVSIKFTTDAANDWHIPLWQNDIDATDTEKKNFDRCIWIEQGESIYFSVNKNNNTLYDAVDFNINIQEVETINIPWADVNHADPYDLGSIAWYFAQFGVEKTYVLTNSSQSYIVDSKSTLEIPERSSLINGTNEQYAKIYMVQLPENADNTLYSDQMIKLNDESSLRGLKINAQGAAKHVILASNKKYFRLDYNAVFSSRNNFDNSVTSASPHLVFLPYCQNIIIKDNVLRNAGCNSTDWNTPNISKVWHKVSKAALIVATDNVYSAFINNNLKYALTHGITIGNSNNILIDGNIIYNTGLNYSYSANNLGDGISGYHPSPPDQILNYEIRNNTIFYSKNHGIHLAGKFINIKNNLIRHTNHNGIFLGDSHKENEASPEKRAVSYDCTISGNNIAYSGLAEQGFHEQDILVQYACNESISIPEGSNIASKILIDESTDFCSVGSSRASQKSDPATILEIEEYASSEIIMFPNPIDSYLNIYFNNHNQQNVEVTIYYVTGEKIYQARTKDSQVKIDTSDFLKGIYLISINSGSELITGKFIK